MFFEIRTKMFQFPDTIHYVVFFHKIFFENHVSINMKKMKIEKSGKGKYFALYVSYIFYTVAQK